MPSTYVNNLRLEEMATGEKSGTWGTITNSNLELVGEALGYGTEALASDADATITMADGASDGIRSLYVKITSGVSLTTTRTITLAPNTVSKVWIIENATSGSQSITVSQGSGSNVTIGNGQVAIVYTDGGGASANVVDALTDINIPSLYLAGTQVTSTAAELNILDGVTATTAELNILDGVTADSTDLNRTDITTEGTVEASKVVTADSNGDVNFPDNEKAIFGAGSDLQIYHDGSASYISDQGTGNLKLLGTDVQIRNAADNKAFMYMTDGGSITLNYNDSQKLATTNTGVSVTGAATGTLTTDNDLSFDMSASNNFKCTPSGTGTLTFTNITSGQSGNIWLDNSGGHAISAASTTYIAAADLTTINTAGVYFLSYYSDGTNVLVSATPALTSAGA
jgi:hypothetical protein